MQRFLFAIFVVALLISPNAFAFMERSSNIKLSYSETVKRVSPAVVNIYTKKTIRERSYNPFANDPFFSQFFGQESMRPMQERVERSLGSGVVVAPEGILVTNLHVIEGADKIQVIYSDGREKSARFINADKRLDIAVLRIDLEEGEYSPYVEFGNSNTVEVGDVSLAIGNPYGVGQSVSLGIISAVGRSTNATGPFQSYIQTDAAINPGNSGGALVDSTGRLVGVNTAIFSKSGGSQGIGFAVPANAVKSIVEQIVTTGKVRRAWLGATGQDMDPTLATTLGLKSPSGVLINEVVSNSPADAAGIEVGDIVLQFNNITVKDVSALNNQLVVAKVGTNVALRVLKNGKEKTLFLPLRALPDRKKEDKLKIVGKHPLTGIIVEQLSPALNRELGFDINENGVVVIKKPEVGGFFRVDLRPGDKLVSINKQVIESLDDLQAALKGRPRSWKIVYQRGSRTYRVVVQ